LRFNIEPCDSPSEQRVAPPRGHPSAFNRAAPSLEPSMKTAHHPAKTTAERRQRATLPPTRPLAPPSSRSSS
jgi:hypothetical protein